MVKLWFRKVCKGSNPCFSRRTLSGALWAVRDQPAMKNMQCPEGWFVGFLTFQQRAERVSGTDRLRQLYILSH